MDRPLPAQLPFDVQQLEGVFSPLFGDQPIQVCEVISGNINTIIKVETGGQFYGLRVRTQEQVYRYEPDLIKEAFVAWLMDQGDDAKSDMEATAVFSQILTARRGSVLSQSTVLPKVRYYDWSRELLAHPYSVYEWVEGIPLWDAPEEQLYFLAGQALTTIHRIQFSAFYKDFLSFGSTPASWTERYHSALDKEVNAAQGRLSNAIIKALAELSVPSTVLFTPCLVHNDFSPANILIHNGAITAVIDWDNAVIDAAHLDFVKMKYWTAKDASGQLSHDPVLFRAFVEGYGPTGQEIVGSSIFALYEVLWLLRVFNFEMSKQEQGIPQTPGYPQAAVYAEFLTETLGRLKQS